MPKSKRVRNSVIDRLVRDQKKSERAMRTIKPIPKGTYKERSEFFGKGAQSADYQGPGSIGGEVIVPGTKDDMPGTTPIMPDEQTSTLDRILQFLKINPKSKKKKSSKPKYPGFM